MSWAQPATTAKPILRRSESDGPRQPPGSWFDCWRCPTEPLARAASGPIAARVTTGRGGPECGLAPAPSYGFVVALKFVALERDKKVGQIAFCDRDRSATHCLTTNWQLHWTQPRTGFGLLPRCNGWPQLDRVFDAEPDLVERSGRLATSSGLIGGRFPYQNEYGLNPARSSEALPASLWGRFPATNGSQAGLCRQH